MSMTSCVKPVYEKYIEINPTSEINFIGPFIVPLESHLTLKNLSDDIIKFKIKTTAPSFYKVNPTDGFMEGHEIMIVKIYLMPFMFDYNADYKHKFKVMAVMYNAFNNVDNWELINDPSYIEYKLKCVLIMPAPEHAKYLTNDYLKLHGTFDETLDRKSADTDNLFDVEMKKCVLSFDKTNSSRQTSLSILKKVDLNQSIKNQPQNIQVSELERVQLRNNKNIKSTINEENLLKTKVQTNNTDSQFSINDINLMPNLPQLPEKDLEKVRVILDPLQLVPRSPAGFPKNMSLINEALDKKQTNDLTGAENIMFKRVISGDTRTMSHICSRCAGRSLTFNPQREELSAKRLNFLTAMDTTSPDWAVDYMRQNRALPPTIYLFVAFFIGSFVGKFLL